MKVKKILGVVLLIVGIAAFSMGYYIHQQVLEGKIKIAKAESTLSTGQSLFSITPETKLIGKGLTRGAQGKIDEGKQAVQKYETIAAALKTSGILAGLLGIGIFAWGFKRNTPG